MDGKIALEEHFSTKENNGLWDSAGEANRNGKAYMDHVDAKLMDPGELIRLMDKHGIEMTIASLTSPGVQGILDPEQAKTLARDSNDYARSKYVDAYPSRLAFFAAVALQDPQSAAEELERAVRQLGAKGALINGFTNIGVHDTARYLDEPENMPFWEKVAELDVPVYLHPREPLAAQQGIYRDYGSLIGSAWGFGHETGTHAVRLMMSGLFDRFPNLQIVLGHLGEGLPYLLPRLEHRLDKQREGAGLGSAEQKMSHYLNNNFLLTTSGHFHTQALSDAISEVGANRVLFSVDYPYEAISEGAEWFDAAPLSDNDRAKIGRENAKALFKL